MYTSFENMPDEAGLWIYQSPVAFSDATANQIASDAKQFCEQWTVHGHPIAASCMVIDNRFLVLAAGSTEHQASGCSIDSSVRFIKETEQKYALMLTDRTTVVFVRPGGVPEALPLASFKSEVKKGTIAEEVKLYDITHTTVGAFRGNFPVPLAQSWAAGLLAQVQMQ